MNTIQKRILFLLVIVVIFCPIYAQQNDALFIREKIRFARFTETNTERKMSKDTIFLKSVLNAKQEDEFRLKRETTDNLGITQKRYQQYYKGIKVENAEYLVHGKGDNIEYINGDFQNINIQNVAPILNEQQALLKALKYVGAERYDWEDARSANYPQGELLISKDYQVDTHAFKLAWKFVISSLQPFNEQSIYVDANKGDIIRDQSLMINANTTGTAQTKYSGMQNITCGSYSGGYRLYEIKNTTSGNTAVIHTVNFFNADLNRYSYDTMEFSNTTANWSSGMWTAFSQDQVALDAHWGAEKVLEYWANIHNRNSLDDKGLPIISHVHFASSLGASYAGAFWIESRNLVCYGDGTFDDGSGITYGIKTSPWTSLDVVGHETGHGIIQHTANLLQGTIYGATSHEEANALSEGFADIWAVCVKNYAAPTKSKWLIFDEITTDFQFDYCRNLQNPKDGLASEGLCPNTYKGQYWRINNTPPILIPQY